jgi:hypothetical protein
MRYRDLVEDGHIPGLMVHPDWWEPRHPQEIPVTVTDPIALWRPSPEISIETGYGDPENLDGGTTPTAPNMGAVISGTTSEALSGNETHTVSTNAVTYSIGEWLFIELDVPSTYFVSRITTETNSPTFTIPFTTAFTGAAASGNNFYIGEDGG